MGGEEYLGLSFEITNSPFFGPKLHIKLVVVNLHTSVFNHECTIRIK